MGSGEEAGVLFVNPLDTQLRRLPSLMLTRESTVSSASERSPLAGAEVGRLPTLVDIQTVSRSFGISMRQVRRFVANGEIPFVRVGHLIRFDPEELNDWIDARRSCLNGLSQE